MASRVREYVLARMRERRSLAEEIRRAREREEAKVAQERAKFLHDPTQAQKMIGDLMLQHVPPSRLKRIPGRDNPYRLEAIKKAIPEGDPRREMIDEIWQDYNKVITDPRFEKVSPKDIIRWRYDERLREKAEAIHERTAKLKTSPFRTFMARDIVELPDQAAWEERAKREGRYPEEYSRVERAGALGALMGVAGEYLKRKGLKIGLRRAAMYAPTPYGKAALMGLSLIPDFLAFEWASHRIRKSDWAKEHPKEALMAELAGGMVTAAGVEKGIKAIPKAWRALTRKGIEKEAMTALMRREPSAENLVLYADLAKSEKAAAEKAAKDWYRENLRKARVKPGTAGLPHEALPPPRRPKALPGKVGEPIPQPPIPPRGPVPMRGTVVPPMVQRTRRFFETPILEVGKREVEERVPIITGEKAEPFADLVKRLGGRVAPKEPIITLPTGIPSRAKRVKTIPVREENMDLVFKKIEEGKPMEQSLREAAAEQVIIDDYFGIAAEAKKGVGPKTVEKLMKKGFTKEEVVRFTPEVARALIKDEPVVSKINLAQKEARRVIVRKAPKKPDPTLSKESKIDLTEKGKATPNVLDDIVADAFEGVGIGKSLARAQREGKITKEEASKLYELLHEAQITAGRPTGKQLLERLRGKPAVEPLEKRTRRLIPKEFEKDLPEIELMGKEFIEASVYSDIKKGEEKLATLAAKLNMIKKDKPSLFQKVIDSLSKVNRRAIEKYLAGTALATTLVMLQDLLSPKEAEANPRVAAKLIEEIGAERVVTKFNLETAKAWVTGGVTELVQKMKDAGFLPVSSGSPYVLDSPMRAAQVIPDVSMVTNRKELPKIFEILLTPYTKFHYWFGVDKAGMETQFNPMVQWANHRTCAFVNTENALRVFNNIVSEVKGYSDATKEVEKAMKPLVDKYMVDLQEKFYHESMVKRLKRKLEREERRIAKRSKGKRSKLTEKEGAEAVVEELRKQVAFHEERAAALKPLHEAYLKDWEATVKPLAAKFPSVRIYLAAEDTATFDYYPFLQGLLSPEEKLAVARIKRMNEDIAVRILETKGQVLESRPYMPHTFHPATDLKRIEERIQEIHPWTNVPPPMVKIFSRAEGMMPMMPEANYTMQRYLPEINLRIEARHFWKYKQKGGWWEFKEKMKAMAAAGMGPSSLVRAFDSFEEAFKPIDRYGVNKWIERLYAFEVMRLLGFSASVPFKHMLKSIADLRIFGKEGAKVIPEAAARVTKIGLRNAGGLERLKEQGISFDVIDEAIQAFTNQGKLYRQISDFNTFSLTESQWDKVMARLNEIGGAPVAAVEKIDRGISVLATLQMAAKKGMTPAQAVNAVFDTILKTNFLSGALNPAWLRDPKIRMAMMFQGTPYKIMEQRMLMWWRATKGIRKGLKAIRSEEEALDLVRQFKLDIKEGEIGFKWALFKAAMMSERDLFGTPIVKQMMREIYIAGAIMGLAHHYLDAEMSHHLFHPPFVKFRTKDIAISASPAFRAVQGAIESWLNREHLQDESMLTNFFKDWFGRYNKGYPVPVNFVKVMRLGATPWAPEDVPEIYRGTPLEKLFYVLAIPKASHD